MKTPWRRRVLAYLDDRFSDGSTIINVWLNEWKAIVPTKRPRWVRWLLRVLR